MEVIDSSIGRPEDELCPVASLQLPLCSSQVWRTLSQLPLLLDAPQWAWWFSCLASYVDSNVCHLVPQGVGREMRRQTKDDSPWRFTFLANVMLYLLLTVFTQEYSLMVLSSKIPCVPWSCELHHITTMRVQHGITSLETTRRKARWRSLCASPTPAHLTGQSKQVRPLLSQHCLWCVVGDIYPLLHSVFP